MKDKILEICVFEDNTIKLTVNGQQRHCSRIEFIAEVGEVTRLITNEIVCKVIEPEAVYVDGKELKPPKTADKSWLETPKRKRGRPRKAKAEEPKPKRPVGRPKNIKNQKIEKLVGIRSRRSGTCKERR